MFNANDAAKGFAVGILFWAADFSYRYYSLGVHGAAASLVFAGSALIALGFLLAYTRLLFEFSESRHSSMCGLAGISFVASGVLHGLLGGVLAGLDVYAAAAAAAILSILVYVLFYSAIKMLNITSLGLRTWQLLRKSAYLLSAAVLAFYLYRAVFSPESIAEYILLGLSGLVLIFTAAMVLDTLTHRIRNGNIIGLVAIAAPLAYVDFLYSLEIRILLLIHIAGALCGYIFLKTRKEYAAGGKGIENIIETQESSPKGAFKSANYTVSGNVEMERRDSKLSLVFDDNFYCQAGPELSVILTRSVGEPTRDEVDGGASVNRLKALKGAQSYELTDAHMSLYNTVVIFSGAYNIMWGYAGLR